MARQQSGDPVVKVVRRYSTALRIRAKGSPILRLKFGRDVLHVVYVDSSRVDFAAVDSIELINADGATAGLITLRHLDRLGNANHAKADPVYLMPRAFPIQGGAS